MPKNNLGIICKHGYNEKIKKNSANGIVYFEEAIRQKNDYLSMYNLTNIYIYDENIKQNFNKSIKLLIKSSKKFEHSMILLCLVLIKKFGFNIEIIMQNIKKQKEIDINLSTKIYLKIEYILSFGIQVFESLYSSYKDKDFLYNIELQPILTKYLESSNEDIIQSKFLNAKDISSEFYDGFGRGLL